MNMTLVKSFAVLPLLASALAAQTFDFRNTSWGMNREKVVAAEGASPSQVGEVGSQIVLRYDSIHFAGLDCRVVYIFAKDRLVRTKYVFQQKHNEQNDFLADFALVETFLIGMLDRPTEQRVSWRNDTNKTEPRRYGAAVSLGQLLYATQWKRPRTFITHALTGANGAITHEIEYGSVDLEPWEDQVTKQQAVPTNHPPIQTAAVP
jgi:hypothetical protein